MFVLRHLHDVQELSDKNQMNAENLATMLGPTSSWSSDPTNLINMTNNLVKQNKVFKSLIENVKQLDMLNKWMIVQLGPGHALDQSWTIGGGAKKIDNFWIIPSQKTLTTHVRLNMRNTLMAPNPLRHTYKKSYFDWTSWISSGQVLSSILYVLNFLGHLQF